MRKGWKWYCYWVILLDLALVLVLGESIEGKVVLLLSVFRHGERNSYIDFNRGRRNDNSLTLNGQYDTYISGKEFISKFSTGFPLEKSRIICYEGERPRTIQSLSLRLQGMYNLPYNPYNSSIITSHLFNERHCNLPLFPKTLFPNKQCEHYIHSKLSSNQAFITYVNHNITQRLRNNTLLNQYLNAAIYYNDRHDEDYYRKLYLISDYLLLNNESISISDEREENALRKAMSDYPSMYFKSMYEDEEVVMVMVSKFYQVLIEEIDRIIQGESTNDNDNQGHYMLFSSHEFSLYSIVKSLNIIKEDQPSAIHFNDNLTLTLSINSTTNQSHISIYYNHLLIKLSNCPLHCPYAIFKHTILRPYLSSIPSLESLCQVSSLKKHDL